MDASILEVGLYHDYERYVANGFQRYTDAYATINRANAYFRATSTFTTPIQVAIGSQISVAAPNQQPFTIVLAPNSTNTYDLEASRRSFSNILRSQGESSTLGDFGTVDTWMFLSGLTYTSTERVAALAGSACLPRSSSYVAMSTNRVDITNDLLIARAAARILNATYDLGTTCDASRFVMSTSPCLPSSPSAPCFAYFSQCSVDQMESFRASPLAACLATSTRMSVSSCGDNVVSGNEQCDCGSADCSTKDPCCDGATCVLKLGAQCSAVDPCCTPKCELRAAGTTCRPVSPFSNGCDVADVCNGILGACPQDVNVAQGTPCNDGYDAANATCYNGRCVSIAGFCASLSHLAGRTLVGACDSGSPSSSRTPCGDLRCRDASGTCSLVRYDNNSYTALEPPGAKCGGTNTSNVRQCDYADGSDRDPAPACRNSVDLQVTVQSHRWVSSPWSSCSVNCSSQTGVKTRVVGCIDNRNVLATSESLCNAGERPASSLACTGPFECSRRWNTTEWRPCSASCGPGVRTRSVDCWVIGSNTFTTVSQCRNVQEPRPVSSEACNLGACQDASFQVGAWSPCSTTCGSAGIRTRAVTCVAFGGEGIVVNVSRCTPFEATPPSTQSCTFEFACSGPAQWVFTAWSNCSSTCEGGVEARGAQCTETATGDVVDFRNCGPQPPNSEYLRPCAVGIPCVNRAVWFASGWKPCSPSDPDYDGTTTRGVSCVDSETNAVLDEERCTSSATAGPQPATSKTCSSVPAWEYSNWSQCSTTCGPGVRTRELRCVDSTTGSVTSASACPAATRPSEALTESCVAGTCAGATYAWTYGAWSVCQSSTQTRVATCT
ncbi:MAG: thrombospondin type-1 domain-containing protein, partial [Gemmatimonas sp.]